MGQGRMAPSDNKAFSPSCSDIPIAAPPEPQLGKVFEFSTIVPRRAREVPKVPHDVIEMTGMHPGHSMPPGPSVKPTAESSGASGGVAGDTGGGVATGTGGSVAGGMGSGTAEISHERLAFLVRVERLMLAESRIQELEAENRNLLSIVSRLHGELEEIKKGAQKA